MGKKSASRSIHMIADRLQILDGWYPEGSFLLHGPAQEMDQNRPSSFIRIREKNETVCQDSKWNYSLKSRLKLLFVTFAIFHSLKANDEDKPAFEGRTPIRACEDSWRLSEMLNLPGVDNK